MIGIIIQVITCIFLLLLSGFVVKEMTKDVVELLNSGKILRITVLVLIMSPVATYLIARFFRDMRDLYSMQQIGSADAWIGFAGSIIGGAVTLVALYLTLMHDENTRKKDHIKAIRPMVANYITNYDEKSGEIVLTDYIGDYGHIKCTMRNISNNAANSIKIKNEYTYAKIGGKWELINDLSQDYGISIFVVKLQTGFFLAPQEEKNWYTNISVEKDAEGAYQWEGSSFLFRHSIEFELTDIENTEQYINKFEYDINISIDTEKHLHFYLDNIANYSGQAKVARKGRGRKSHV